jgi:hypothetical protein
MPRNYSATGVARTLKTMFKNLRIPDR